MFRLVPQQSLGRLGGVYWHILALFIAYFESVRTFLGRLAPNSRNI
jgi:hypothetical protein